MNSLSGKLQQKYSSLCDIQKSLLLFRFIVIYLYIVLTFSYISGGQCPVLRAEALLASFPGKGRVHAQKSRKVQWKMNGKSSFFYVRGPQQVFMGVEGFQNSISKFQRLSSRLGCHKERSPPPCPTSPCPTTGAPEGIPEVKRDSPQRPCSCP